MNRSTQRIVFWLGAIGIIVVSVLVVLSGSSTTTVDPNATGKVTLTEPVNSNDWTKGNPDAKIQIVEYSDFECPACQYYYPIIERVVREFESHVSFTYRHFPIRSKHKLADPAAWASEAAGQQGKFWEMYDMLFANQDTWVKQDIDQAKSTFDQYAQDLGLDIALFQEAMESSAVKSAVDKDLDGGVASGVNGTPSLFMNGVKFEQNPSVEEFRSIIRAELAKTTE